MALVQVNNHLWLPNRSLKFGAAPSNRLSVSAAPSINSKAPLSAAVLLRPNGNSVAARGIIAKRQSGVAGWFFQGTTGSQMQLTMDWTVDAGFVCSDGDPVLAKKGQWVWCLFSADPSASPTCHIYSAVVDFVKPMTVRESSYSTATNGSGTPGNDSAAALSIGQQSSANTGAFPGDIALAAIWGRALSAQEFNCFINRPFPAGTLGYWLPGDNGIPAGATQWDLSGNGNHGTPTGLTVESGPAGNAPIENRTHSWLSVPGAAATENPAIRRFGVSQPLISKQRGVRIF